MAVHVRIRTTVLMLCLALTAVLVAALPARAEPAVWKVSAPSAHAGHGPGAVLRLDPSSGSPSLEVTHDGQTVIEPSPVGIVTERADLSTGLRLLGHSDRTVSESYRTTVGKDRNRHARMAEARFRFGTAEGARLDLLVRVSGDGVAYRYVLPVDTGNVLGETSAFTLPAGSAAWLGKYRRDNENLFTQYDAAGAPPAST